MIRLLACPRNWKKLTVWTNPRPGRAIQLSPAHPTNPGRIISEGWIFLPDWQHCGGAQCNQTDHIVYYSDDNARSHTAAETILRPDPPWRLSALSRFHHQFSFYGVSSWAIMALVA